MNMYLTAYCSQSNAKGIKAYCLCASQLQRMTASQRAAITAQQVRAAHPEIPADYPLETEMATTCDVCKKRMGGDMDDILYNCPIQHNEIHPAGFDVCEECVADNSLVSYFDLQIREYLHCTEIFKAEFLLECMY